MDTKPIGFKTVSNFYKPKIKGTPRNHLISGSFYGASDLTRTGDLLITSAKIRVFICGFTIKKVLQRNDNLKIMFHDIVKH